MVKQYDNPMNTTDIMPTSLGLCGLKIPSSMKGTNVSKLVLTGKDASLPSSAYINTPVSTFQLRECGFDVYRGVRTVTHTYVRSIHGPWLLYDNSTDPYQKHNLRGKPEARAVQASLDAK